MQNTKYFIDKLLRWKLKLNWVPTHFTRRKYGTRIIIFTQEILNTSIKPPKRKYFVCHWWDLNRWPSEPLLLSSKLVSKRFFNVFKFILMNKNNWIGGKLKRSLNFSLSLPFPLFLLFSSLFFSLFFFPPSSPLLPPFSSFFPPLNDYCSPALAQLVSAFGC